MVQYITEQDKNAAKPLVKETTKRGKEWDGASMDNSNGNGDLPIREAYSYQPV